MAAALGSDARHVLTDLAEAGGWSARGHTASCASHGRSPTWLTASPSGRTPSSLRPACRDPREQAAA